MKIDREKLKEYANKGDSELWLDVRGMTKKYGYTLPELTPPHEDMERLRGILRGDEKISLSEGMKLLNNYKKRNGG